MPMAFWRNHMDPLGDDVTIGPPDDQDEVLFYGRWIGPVVKPNTHPDPEDEDRETH